ncbi:DUF262 domain-containing protein [Corynebacterium sp. ES2730-CONJ]|uniref:DUF262 domain-containing protein n=1 Tax=Corynebacterium sp. ES2730-CONJ TaxID=2973941 RepID=UPI00216B5427|nr:DUF262 domain-containing protein [Corynebacterium sp. ES2730-CONJ]MCS4531535.1 DUF262 domain-containing protein [Corynebacterium sp. ES2730-CONJ]
MNIRQFEDDDSRKEYIEPISLTHEEEEETSYSNGDPYEVSYYGQDFDAIGLVRRLDEREILIPRFDSDDEEVETEGFQRTFVWKKPQQDRFIESILLGYPIPNIFLVKQQEENFLVLDGQQRLITLQNFLPGEGGDGKKFKLENVSEQFKGKAYFDLEPRLQRKLKNSLIQAIILSTTPKAANHRAVYQIFERLNSGGTQLTAHEIRIASFPGKLVHFVAELNREEDWRNLYGQTSPRVRDHELVTRILAMFLDWESYARPLKGFLNKFMENGLTPEVEKAGSLFKEASRRLNSVGDSRSILRLSSNQVNTSWSDAIYVGLMKRLEANCSSLSDGELERIIEKCRTDDDFRSAISRSTADEKNVKSRMELAIAAFADGGHCEQPRQ